MSADVLNLKFVALDMGPQHLQMAMVCPAQISTSQLQSRYQKHVVSRLYHSKYPKEVSNLNKWMLLGG